MNDRAPRVAGAGICCVDYIVTSPQVDYGDTALVSRYEVQGGGLIGTALVACARLGAGCDILSVLGDDDVGEQILTDLRAERIGSGHVVRMPGGESPFSFIHVDDKSGERTIFHRSGKGLSPSSQDISAVVSPDWDSLLVDDIYLDLSIAAAGAAHQQGVPVVADLIPDARNASLLAMVDVLIAPRHYARQLGYEDNLDAALDAIHALGPTTAVVTLGADGWVCSDSIGRCSGQAFNVDVVDTTGAGDTFHGAFAYALARGWTTRRCCEFSSAVAAIKCTKPGGRTGLPSLDQVEAFMRARGC